MKKTIKLFIATLVLGALASCSGVKVVNAWKSDTVADMKDNNILVIARTSNNQARIAFESEISKKLNASGFKATPSYSVFPASLNPEKELTEEQQKNFRSFLSNEGYNGIVVSVVKDYQESTKTTTDGGYYAGASYSSFYPMYYGGFYGYYGHPYSYSTYGNYVPSSSTTSTYKTFVLETVAYDLDQEDGKQLAAVVTSKIEDPKDVSKNAKEYTEKIAESLKNAK